MLHSPYIYFKIAIFYLLQIKACNFYNFRMLTLSQLGDISRYLKENFRNQVYIITEDKPIKCSGILLASRSTIIEEIIENSENIPAIEFSDNIPGLFACLKLVYGGSVDISKENYRSILKFGIIFQIPEMVDAVLSWIAEDLPQNIFWEVYFDLRKLDLCDSSTAFLEATKRYISSNCDEFLQNTVDVCHHKSDENVRVVMKLVSATDYITSDRMLTLFTDLLNTAPDDDTTPSSSTSSPAKRVDTIISCAVGYIEKHDVDMLDIRGTEIFLRKISSICNEVQNLRKIAKMLGDILQYKEIAISSVGELSWKFIRILTSPATLCDTIRYFTEHAGTELHPCITAEIVLKWWSVREGVCPDNTFIKTIFTKVQDVYSKWVYNLISDSRYKDMVVALGLRKPAVHRIFYYGSIDSNTNKIKECIQAGDGTPLVLPVESMHCSDNMAAYKETVPAFRYNPAVVPPYTINNAHWYLECEYKDNGVITNNFISFITNTQQEIVNHLESCTHAWLLYVPLPDSDSI